MGDQKYEIIKKELDVILISFSRKLQATQAIKLLKKNQYVIKAELADELPSNNNSKKKTDSNVIQMAWNNICLRSADVLEKVNAKLADVEQAVDITKHTTKSKVNIDDVESRLKLIEVKKQHVKELRDQKREFESFQETIREQISSLNPADNNKLALERLSHEFALECKRLENALPIYSKKSSIIQMIKENQVTILTAETGSGKSTQIVQYLHQEGFGLIACTQPRKIAAISLAKRVAEEMDSAVGQTVGFSVGMQTKANKALTSIMFMTDQLLLNECLHDPLLKRYGCVIVDEAHERSISTDLLLAMLKKALLSRPEFRVVISSATIDPTIFEKYFHGMSSRLHVHGRTYPVELVWENNSKRLEYLQAAIAKAKDVHSSERKGDVLVFLTTPIETEKAQEQILNDPTLEKDVLCLVLHGRLQSEEQQRVFDPAPNGKRKIVFATNSAETSITIPNIRYVIDSGMVKEKHYNTEKNVSILRIGPINKSSAVQRMGRAGRTQEGKCFRLFTLEEYKDMSDEMLPEILRENLGVALLSLYQIGIKNPFNYDFVQPPPTEALLKASEELSDLGAVRNDTLTQYGKIMAALHIDPRLGKFVALGIEEDIPLDVMVIAAICSVGGHVFFRSGSDEAKKMADRLKTRFCSGYGDMLTLLEVYKEWSQEEERERSKWCVKHSMNAKTLRSTKDFVSEMKRNVQDLLQVKIENKIC